MMPTPSPRYSPQSATYQVRPRSHEVVDYHYDEQKPGKPLYLLIPGALIALGSLGLIIILAYLTFSEQRIAETLGTVLILALAPFYIGGVFMFSYGYELYDLPKALRLTAIIVFITLAAVVILAALFVVLAALSGGRSSSSRSSSSDSSSSRQSSFGGGGGGVFPGFGPIFVGGISPGSTQTVTREVIKEVPTAPPAPQPIACEYCGRPYIPEETQFACPNCGAPAPKEYAPQ